MPTGKQKPMTKFQRYQHKKQTDGDVVATCMGPDPKDAGFREEAQRQMEQLQLAAEELDAFNFIAVSGWADE